MKKKFIFLAMMLLTFLGVNVLNAQEETITIGSGDETHARVPSNVRSEYSYSQQIYTKDELNIEAGVKITNISLRIAGANNVTRKWKVYMLNLEDKSSFSNNTDWVSVTESDVFYSGDVSINGENGAWIDINSEGGFVYSGNNLLLCIQDYTGTAHGEFIYFYTYTSDDNSCIRKTNWTELTPGNIVDAGNASYDGVMNQIIFTYESSAPAVEPSSVPEITSIEATHNSVTLAWNAVENAKKYNVYTSTGYLVETVNTTSCTIEDLDDLTEYCYQVSAVNGKYETEKSAESCTTTLEAPETRNIVFTLNDSYGDGWTGNKLNVYLNGILEHSLENQNLDGKTWNTPETQTIVIPIIVGTLVRVEYQKGYGSTYPEENSFEIYYEDGSPINGMEKIYEQCTTTTTTHDVVTFTVEPLAPKVTIAASDYDIFSDQTATLTATAANFDGDVTYSWSLNGEIVGTGATYTFDPTSTGSFEFTCTATDANDNEASASVTIIVSATLAGKQFRVKVMEGSYAGSYLDVYNDNGTIGVETKAERNTQIFTMEYAGSQYYLKTADGNYIKCETGSGWWNVHAYNTYDKTPLVFEYTNEEQFYIKDYDKMTGNSQTGDNNNPNNCYFKVENQKVYCDAPSSYTNTETSYITTWSFEEVPPKPENLAIVEGEKTQLYPGETTEISWDALEGAASYNVYVNGVKFNTEAVEGLSYELVNLPYGMNTIAVAAVYADDSESDMSNTIEVEMRSHTIYAKTEKESYDANENIVLFWDAIDPEYVNGYNVYVNNEETPRNADELTSAIYTLEGGLAETGYVYVTAVYKNENYGESAKSYTYVNINNYEYVNLSGTVTDDANNRIAGAEVVVEGYDMNWVEQRYTTLTNAEGAFELEVLPSYEYNDNYCYSVSVSKYGYSSYKSTEKYKAVVGSDIVLDAIVLTANAGVTFTVTATKVEGNVTVEWTAPEGATQYNVFRKDATEEVVKLTTTKANTYTDESWATLENGNYTYGVSALSETTSIVTENFDGYNVPEGWYIPEGSNWRNSGNQMFSNYGAVGNIYYLVTPKIDTRVENATISFRYFSSLFSGKMDELKVYYSTSQDGPWVNEIEDVELSNEWVTKEISLAGIEEDEIYVAFANATIDANGLYLDEVTFPCVESSESSINWATAIEKDDANVFTGAGGTNEWKLATNWSNGVPAGGANVFIESNVTIASNVNVNNMTINGGSVTIDSGASLTVNGTLVNEDEANLVINDGAQIFQNNEDVPATFVMNIINWEDKKENENAWQFIASPLLDASVFSHATGNYDLFKYYGDEDLEWYNHKLHAYSFGNTFEQGVGYLASHETAKTIVMTGTLNNKNTHTWNSYIFTYDYEGDKDVANFNLLGNPFTFNMKWSEVNASEEDFVPGYAYLNKDGGYETAVNGEIAVGDAFFVKTKRAYVQMSYGEEMRGAKAEQSEYINLFATGKAGRDNVIINLAGKQEGFTKMQNFNESIATVYVTEDNTRYGIYNCNSDIEEVVVSFNAKDMGDYTIAAVAEGDFSSVVLVDLFTGIETDLLTSGYTFAAKSGDNAERFVVRFSYSQESAMDSNFVYQSGEDLIIMAEGALQIVDMLGRVVYYSEVATDVTRVNVSNFDNAAYIVRVVNGEGVKTQKVVIY